MDANRVAAAWNAANDPDRPPAFLVSTTRSVRDPARHLGSADYSYGFVLKAFTPVLERLGRWQIVDEPESSLAATAAEAAEAGFRPIHLALHPIHNVYHTPAVPTVLFPFWEFPHLPDRDFQHDTRQNWVRMCRPASLVVAACEFTAQVFRSAGVKPPVATVPVPLDPALFDIPPRDDSFRLDLTCRHLVWGGPSASSENQPLSVGSEPPTSFATRLKRLAKNRYHRHVKPWLSDEARARMGKLKQTLLRQLDPPPPVLPATPLSLGGLIFTSIFNLSDRRKNPQDLLSAFLIAFRDRPDATLVLKLTTSPTREYYELRELEALYRSFGLGDHACRVVVITDFLSDAQMADLLRVSTFYVNTSRAEGACLPLQHALAAGRPALAPRHTAMADYIDEQVAFVLDSHVEPTFWPHDPDRRLETTWHRLVWADLHDAFLEAARIADHDPDRYIQMSRAARDRMRSYAHPDRIALLLRSALARLQGPSAGSLAWPTSPDHRAA